MKKVKFINLAIIIMCAFLSCFALFIGIQKNISAYYDDYVVSLADMKKCDAVLVLGARVYSNGSPSPALKDRLDYAIEVYNLGKADKILASGDHGKKEYDETKGILDYLVSQGIPKEDIFLDHAGFDTYDSLYRAKEIFKVNSLIISTQEFHMPRSLYISRKLNIESYGYPCPNKDIYNMAKLNFRESLARVKAFLDVDIFKSKPTFLGEEIPIFGDGLITQTDYN